METPAKQRFYGVQVLRGVASVLVVLHHQLEVAVDRIPGTPHPRWMDNGAFGVDLFFPISGFVMWFAAESLIRKVGNWREFAWRRVVRVGPLYWLFTTLKVMLAVLFPAAMLHYRLRMGNVVASYFFVPSVGQSGQPLPVLPVGWTLNYEAFFYVLVGVAIAWRLRVLRWVGWGLVVVACVGAFVPRGWGAWTFLGDSIVLEFLGGMLLARFAGRAQWTPTWVAIGLIVGGVGFALAVPNSPELVFQAVRVLEWGVPGALVMWGVLALEGRMPMKDWRAALLVGDASYSLYLSHTFVLPALALVAARIGLAGVGGLVWFSVVTLPICLVIGVLVHWWVELPMLRSMEGWRVPWVVRSAEMSEPAS